MWLTIEIPTHAESRLAAEANRLNRPPAEVARDMVVSAVLGTTPGVVAASGSPSSDVTHTDQATLDLIARRLDVERTDDPAEIAEAEADWQAFQSAMNAHSTRGRPIYP